MFSGIVEEVGEVRDLRPNGEGVRIRIGARAVLEGLRLGDSVAVDGVCLTAVALEPDAFDVEAIATTLSRTTLGEWSVGRRVNLERALRVGDRLGGHFVQGHVDGVGTVVLRESRQEHTILGVRLPPEAADVTVLHGSVAINGVSLTVHEVDDGDVVRVALIPYTLEHTNLSALRPGDSVNVEGDMIGRFVAHLLERRGTVARG